METVIRGAAEVYRSTVSVAAYSDACSILILPRKEEPFICIRIAVRTPNRVLSITRCWYPIRHSVATGLDMEAASTPRQESFSTMSFIIKNGGGFLFKIRKR